MGGIVGSLYPKMKSDMQSQMQSQGLAANVSSAALDSVFSKVPGAGISKHPDFIENGDESPTKTSVGGNDRKFAAGMEGRAARMLTRSSEEQVSIARKKLLGS